MSVSFFFLQFKAVEIFFNTTVLTHLFSHLITRWYKYLRCTWDALHNLEFETTIIGPNIMQPLRAYREISGYIGVRISEHVGIHDWSLYQLRLSEWWPVLDPRAGVEVNPALLPLPNTTWCAELAVLDSNLATARRSSLTNFKYKICGESYTAQ